MYLVDTDVISESAPSRGAPLATLVAWMDRNSDRLFISAITVAEIAGGIAKSQREGARRKALELERWLDALLHLYADRVLPFDLSAARVAGALSDRARAKGRRPGFADLAIAATAAAHGLTVLSRNLRHFTSLEVPARNPFESLP